MFNSITTTNIQVLKTVYAGTKHTYSILSANIRWFTSSSSRSCQAQQNWGGWNAFFRKHNDDWV